MPDEIRILAIQAAQAKDEGKFSRVAELYERACMYDSVERVRKAFTDAGVSVNGPMPLGRTISMLQSIKD